jgi:hypothetical protein
VHFKLNDQVHGKAGQMMRKHLVKNMHSISKKVYEMFGNWQERKAQLGVKESQAKEEELKLLPNQKKRKFIHISDQGDHSRKRSKSLPTLNNASGNSD